MSMCKFCGAKIEWGMMAERYVPLVPVGEDDGMERTMADEHGVLRASHRAACTSPYTPAVRVQKLRTPVPADMVLPSISKHTEQILERKAQKKRKAKSA